MMSVLFSIMGLTLAFYLRYELDSSSNRLFTVENLSFYNLAFTMHGLIMIFFFVMPGLLGGFGNIMIPLLIGAPEVAFPRVNNLSYLFVFVSYILLSGNLSSEFSNGMGWTMYPPLSTCLMSSSSMGINLIVYGLMLSGISSTLTSVNLFTTIENMRINGMTFYQLDLYVYSVGLTSVLLVVVLPILTGALVLLLLDLHFNTVFFDPIYGGDVVFYQHLFWFFGHPEVYILILPGFGLVSYVLSCTIFSVFSKQSMILAMSCICVLGAIVWAHHLYTIGLDVDTRCYFTCVTMMISLPTGCKIFNYLCSIMSSELTNIFCLANFCLMVLFIITFVIGGCSGVILGNASVDIALHDTYYVIAHFHIILSVSVSMALGIGLLFISSRLLHSMVSFTLDISIKMIIITFLLGNIMSLVPLLFAGYN